MNTNPQAILYDIFNDLTNNDVSKCDIIDIANEEMKDLDIEETDRQFKAALISQATENILQLINLDECTKDNIKKYQKIIDDRDIKDIRVSDKKMYIKTKPLTLSIISYIFGIKEEHIDKIPIKGKYDFYLIDAEKYMKNTSKPKIRRPSYDPANLVEILQKLGAVEIDDAIAESLIDDMIQHAFSERLPKLSDVYIRCNIEDQVVAIGIAEYIPKAKKIIGEALGINPRLFIEVSGFGSTVLLIDTRRWFLERDVLERSFGDEEWYL